MIKEVLYFFFMGLGFLSNDKTIEVQFKNLLPWLEVPSLHLKFWVWHVIRFFLFSQLNYFIWPLQIMQKRNRNVLAFLLHLFCFLYTKLLEQLQKTITLLLGNISSAYLKNSDDILNKHIDMKAKIMGCLDLKLIY